MHGLSKIFSGILQASFGNSIEKKEQKKASEILKQLLIKRNWKGKNNSSKKLPETLAFVTWDKLSPNSKTLSIFLLCEHTKIFNIQDFFLSVLKKGLIPHKPTEIMV